MMKEILEDGKKNDFDLESLRGNYEYCTIRCDII
jgi:hypothetical protein